MKSTKSYYYVKTQIISYFENKLLLRCYVYLVLCSLETTTYINTRTCFDAGLFWWVSQSLNRSQQERLRVVVLISFCTVFISDELY
ncbi:hypothetical protein evm_001309 [Chilo suppressalis]|nr:hypothetical protein evm_001309 [Chilo suppressalis]